MIKILFICHGNICRSPMAEFIFKDMVSKQGLSDRFYIASVGCDEPGGNRQSGLSAGGAEAAGAWH